MQLPDLYVGLDIDLLAPGDGIVTDRHHASSDRYEADDPQNQIAGQISPFTLSGWLRHGCERVVQVGGASAWHPGNPDADYMRADVYDRDLNSGYHEKGTCIEDGDDDAGCVIYDLFGGFGERAGKVIRRPIRFSPTAGKSMSSSARPRSLPATEHAGALPERRRRGPALPAGHPDVVGNLMGI